MRVAVIVVSMLMVVSPSEASESCMSKTEARQHFGLVHIYWHGADHCWDASPGRGQHHVIHKVEAKPPYQPKWRDALSEIVPDEEPAQTPWLDRWVDIKPSELPLVARWVDFPQASLSLTVEPSATPRGMVLLLVLLAIVVAFAMVEVLFPRGMIYRRGSLAKT